MKTHENLLFGRQVKVSRMLPGPIDRVWDYLTRSELLARWLAVGQIGTTGSRIHMVQTADTFPWKRDGYLCGVVIESRPPERLTYSFKHIPDNYEEDDVEESIVEFSLYEQRGSVRLELIHSRLGREELPWVYAEWNSHLEFLMDELVQQKIGAGPPGRSESRETCLVI